MKVDVIIIGAGPAGGAAACRLAESGLRVVLLERQRLPRVKACGGAMPATMRTALGWDITPLIEAEATVEQDFLNYGHPRTKDRTQSPILMVDRSRFDFHFVDRAITLGRGNVIVRDGWRVSQVEEDARGITVRGDHGEICRADFLIAADGAFGVAARGLGLVGPLERGPAIDAEVEVSPDVYEREKNRATFNFYCLPNGYGWIFPKDGMLSCGVVCWQGRTRLPHALDAFLARSLPPDSIRSVRRLGHTIPCYAGRQVIATRRACLAGDAAGLADPILGEGIRFALKSGRLAADIVQSVAQGAPLPELHEVESALKSGECLVYSDQLHQHLGKELGFWHRFGRLSFLGAPDYYYRKFVLGSAALSGASTDSVTGSLEGV